MKKLILLLPAIFLIFQSVQAQKPDAAVALIYYTFSHIRDTTNRANVYTENMELLLGKNASVYRSTDHRLESEQLKRLIAEQRNAGATGTVSVKLAHKPHDINKPYYQFQAEKKLIRQEKQVNYYLVEEVWPVMNWKITTDTTSFKSLHCQKAITVFKGRSYEAWFCPALPFRSGPWKFNGLPGLILEVSDSRKEVVFKFAGLEDVSKITESPDLTTETNSNAEQLARNDENISLKTIALPKYGIKATQAELSRLEESTRKDPMAFMKTAMAGSGTSVKSIKVNGSNSSMPATVTSVKNKINNPIELSKKP
ncbi:MAG: GLPGLI family protein [Sphingobacteriaceae bacterium]|nr:MAG: GLPGLI family protein [Sphingobacteriaceae bacterium]